MGTETYLIILLAFMIVGAIIAAETRSLLSSVISLGAIGVGVSIAFLFIAAPDLAIVQVSVEVLLLLFFIRSTIGREVEHVQGQIRWPGLAFAILLSCAVLGIGIFALRGLPRFGYPIIETVKEAPSNIYLSKGLKETGAPNIVAAIILDYRGYDTLGEATVLFTAVLGALAILRGRAKRGKEK
jgi:multisubunit Na+/H+ antiporter MnhB subunit